MTSDWLQYTAPKLTRVFAGSRNQSSAWRNRERQSREALYGSCRLGRRPLTGTLQPGQAITPDRRCAESFASSLLIQIGSAVLFCDLQRDTVLESEQEVFISSSSSSALTIRTTTSDHSGSSRLPWRSRCVSHAHLVERARGRSAVGRGPGSPNGSRRKRSRVVAVAWPTIY